jgi:hypothetical protein
VSPRGIRAAETRPRQQGRAAQRVASRPSVGSTGPSLVDITAIAEDGSQKSGTGIVLDSDGLVLTNRHDTSKPGNARWCETKICGNRITNLKQRSRRRADG